MEPRTANPISGSGILRGGQDCDHIRDNGGKDALSKMGSTHNRSRLVWSNWKSNTPLDWRRWIWSLGLY